MGVYIGMIHPPRREMDEIRQSIEKFIKASEFGKAFQLVEYSWRKDNAYDLVEEIRRGLRQKITEENWELLKRSYDLTAREVFDDFCIATEWNRSEKFYLPRRKALLPIVKEMQRLADDEIDLLCVSLPPGVGKTGIAIFFLCWLAGRNPKDGMLVGSHNQSFVRDVYAECIREIGEGEYRWGEIFDSKIARTNTLDLKIDIDVAQRFSTLQFTSAGSGNAGKLRAIQLLYCDDLIEGIEEAMSKERLDKKWRLYTDDLRQRKQGLCKELHIATRWSVHDVIGRLKEMHENNPRASFLTVPALNEKGESNFDYGGSQGFTTEFFEDVRDTMDDASFNALYMNEPIEREGILYRREELRRYYSLPEGEPDSVLAVCDTSSGAGDDTVMPIFYVYGNEHYLVDMVCCAFDPIATVNMCAEKLIEHNVKSCQFESNASGGSFADNVDKRVLERGGKVHITKKWTQANKDTKIIFNSGWVKTHCLFLDDSRVERRSVYWDFLNKLCSYTVASKNKHDDVPDAMAQYSLFIENAVGSTATILKRPF